MAKKNKITLKSPKGTKIASQRFAEPEGRGGRKREGLEGISQVKYPSPMM